MEILILCLDKNEIELSCFNILDLWHVYVHVVVHEVVHARVSFSVGNFGIADHRHIFYVYEQTQHKFKCLTDIFILYPAVSLQYILQRDKV